MLELHLCHSVRGPYSLSCFDGSVDGTCKGEKNKDKSRKLTRSKDMIKLVDPTKFPKGWATDAKHACKVPNCVMPLNMDKKSGRCFKAPCGMAMRSCRQFILLFKNGECHWKENGLQTADGKTTTADGYCSGESACGESATSMCHCSVKEDNKWVDKGMLCKICKKRDNCKIIKYLHTKLRCYVTKSSICRVKEFNKTVAFRPVSEECTVRKNAWCVYEDTRKPFEPTESCQNVLGQLAKVG